MVSGRNSSGKLVLYLAGMTFCAELLVTERIQEARSSEDNVSGLVSLSADEISRWKPPNEGDPMSNVFNLVIDSETKRVSDCSAMQYVRAMNHLNLVLCHSSMSMG